MNIFSKIILVALIFIAIKSVISNSDSTNKTPTPHANISQHPNILTLTNTNYMQDLLQSDKPVLVKFWAAWCKPCRDMSAEFNNASETFTGEITFAEINVDEQKQVAKKYAIRALPTIILFHNGKVLKRGKGFMNKNQIEAFLENSQF